MHSAWLARLESALGGEALRTGEDGRPSILPRGREAARRALCILAEERVSWRARGGGRRPVEGGELQISTEGLAGLVDLWPEDLVCRVGAGLSLGALDRHLRPLGLRLPASAPLPEQATVGGAFACGDRGGWGSVLGSLREQTLGLSWIDGAGRVRKAGSRTVKNVAGYDMVRLHHGARGAFGLLLDLTVRLEARPPARAVLWRPCPLDGLPGGIAALRGPGVGGEPGGLQWLNASAARASGLGEEAGLLAALEGWDEGVSAWAQRAGGRRESSCWERVRDLPWDGDRVLLRWIVAPSQLGRLWPRAEEELRKAGADPWLLGDLGSGQAMLALRSSRTAGGIGALRRLVEAAAAEEAEFWVERAPGLSLPTAAPGAPERRLSAAFDPHGLLAGPPRPLRGSP